MTMGRGVYTGELGYRLYTQYQNTDHTIYYDHGRDRNSEPNLCRPTRFFDECSRTSTLSYVDIVSVNSKTNSIELIAEIEEGGAEPKKVIGDITNIILSDQVRIRSRDHPSRDYPYSDSLAMILGVKCNPRGGGEEKTRRICQKLMQINERMGNKKMDLICVFDEDLAELAARVGREIEQRLSDV